MERATPGVAAPSRVQVITIPTSSLAGTYHVDTRVYTADGSRPLRYRNDTTFTANRGV